MTEVQLREERLLAAENSRLERGLLPQAAVATDFVSCASHYRPGRARAVLGGDFFDVVEMPDGRVRAVIGDVMGHGPDEAALGVHLRVAWRTLVLADVADDQILVALSRLLEAESPGGIFVTVCDATIDRDLCLTVRVAGHPPPLLLCRWRGQLPRRRVRPAARDPRRAAGAGLAGHAHPARAGAPPWCSTPTACSTPTGRSASLTSVGLDELLEIATGALAEASRSTSCSTTSWRGRLSGPSTTPRSWSSRVGEADEESAK